MKLIDQIAPSMFVILGGVGDFTKQKLIPALFNLFQNNHMPSHFQILIADYSEIGIEKLRKQLHEGVNKYSRHGKSSVHTWNQFALRIQYIRGDLVAPDVYHAIDERYKIFTEERGIHSSLIFYLSVAPNMVVPISKYLCKSGLLDDRSRSRVVVEKTLGKDVFSVIEMNRSLGENIREQQLFRIGHNLGKETFQNILALRFANSIFEPLWNRHHIEYVAITVADVTGVADGAVYDKLGALREMVPGYMLQLLGLITMEPMVSMEANEVRNKILDVLQNIQPITHDSVNQHAVRAQYEKGRIGGRDVPGYRDEVGVVPESTTETYVALKLMIDNWRWNNVPFYLRTGKRMARQVSEIVIQFRPVPHKIFPPEVTADWMPARLVLSILPDPGILLRFLAKQPGLKLQLKPVDMKFNYRDNFSLPLPDAYESLLWDIMRNDATLFMKADQMETAWRLIEPIQRVWAENQESIPLYTTGSWGPKAVQKLFAQKEHQWPEPIVLADYYQRIFKS